MTTADLVLVAILLIGAISGYRQGFLMALFSFAALLLAVLGAFKLLGYAMIFLDEQFHINKSVLPYVAFAAVFIAIVIGVRLLGKLIKISIDRTFLGRVDQVAGAGLGLLKAAFLISVGLWILRSLHLQLPETWTADSWLLPSIAAFAPGVASWLGEYIPFFRNVFT